MKEGEMKRTVLMITAVGLFLFAQTAQAQWTPAKRLTWTSGWSYFPAMAIDSSDHIHIVWNDDTLGNNELHYRRSVDGGATWGAVKRLTWNSGSSYNSAIAIDSNDTIHVVWSDDTPGHDEVYYKQSADGGATWTPAKRLTWNSGASRSPFLAIDSGNTIHVVWHDDTPGNDEIYYLTGANGGATWSSVKRLTWTSDWSTDPSISIDSINTMHLVWADFTPGNYEVYYKRSTDGGATWTPPKRLTWTTGWSSFPAIGIDSTGGLHVVWLLDDDWADDMEISYKRSGDGGITWTPARVLTWNSGDCYIPAMAIDSSDGIHIVWEDFTPGNWEVYYKSSPDGGLNWIPAKRLTWSSGNSSVPAIAIDSTSMVHVVWNDDTPTNAEIYYKKGK
jgi:hypothetical protein